MNSTDFEYIHAAEYARLVRRFSRNKSHIQARWDARKMKCNPLECHAKGCEND